MSILVGFAACRAEVSTPAPSEANLIEFRLVEDVPSEGSQQAMLNGERLILGPTPLVSDSDVHAIAPGIRSGQLLLSIELTEKGQQRIRRATAENIGRRMAFILDGQVKAAPVIRDTISGSPLDVSIQASQSEAERLATKVRSRWQESTGGP
jgi:preprotein translocase subunit SecD